MPRAPSGKTIKERADGVLQKRLTVLLTVEQADQLAHRAIDERRSQSEIIADALSGYLSKPVRKPR